MAKTVTYETKFIDSVRLMASLLSYLAGNLGDLLHNSICKECKSHLKNVKEKDELLIFKCLKCNKKHRKYLTIKDLVKRFANT